MPFNDSPTFSLEQVAKACNRSYVYLRRLYQCHLLPDPVHTIKHKTKTTRKFTAAELQVIKARLQNIKPGDLNLKLKLAKGAISGPAKKKNRARKRTR